MPDMPVLDAIRRIRAAENDSAQASQSGSPSSARAPVLLFGVGESNKTTIEELQPYIEAGLDGYVFSGSIIGKELTNFLQQKKTNPSQFLLSHGH
jgi:CheY-like chemotaxis protein